MSETVRVLQTLQRMLPQSKQLSAAAIEWLYGEMIELEMPEWHRRGNERRQADGLVSVLPRGRETILQELQCMVPPGRQIPDVVIQWLSGELELLENPDWPVPQRSVGEAAAP